MNDSFSKHHNAFPQQAIPSVRKTKPWAKKCIDSVDTINGSMGSKVRSTIMNKVKNYNLWDGIVHKEDMEVLMNPDGFEGSTINTNIQHNPIAVSKFQVLLGEDAQRRFEPQCIVTNPDAVSQKEEAMKEMLRAKVMALLQNPDITDDQREEELRKHKKFLRYEYQDVREVRANRMLKFLNHELRLKKKTNDGLKNAIICAEEIYEIESFGGRLEFNVLNPKNVHTISSGESNLIEDADIIVIQSWRSPGQALDRYHDELTEAQVKRLQNAGNLNTGENDSYITNDKITFFTGDFNLEGNLDSMIDLAELNSTAGNFGPHVDADGNIRELRVLWRSMKRMKLVEYPDPNSGKTEKMYMPEFYMPDPNKGEVARVTYLNDWWEGTKLGKDMYLRMRPKPTQYFRMGNPSVVHPGIVGTIYNTNGGRGVSLVDKIRNFSNMYDVITDRLRDALSTYMGPILEMDMAKVPDGWDFEKWLFYMKKMRIAATDSFKVGNKGPAKGKLAGNFNTTGKVLNLDLGNYIQQMIMLLQFIEAQMALVTGITKQREGQIQNRETVGGVERSVQQSSAITETLFLEHEETVLRAIKYLVEAAKNHYRGQKFTAQYFLDDGSLELFDFDGDEFADADYDVVAVSGVHIEKMRSAMESLAQHGLQNQLIDYTTILDIYMAPSMMDMRRSIEAAEQDRRKREQDNFNAQQETQKKAIESNERLRTEDIELQKELAVLKSNTEIEKAFIMAEGYGFEDNEAEIAQIESKRNTLLEQMKDLDLQMSKDKEKKRQLEIDNAKQTTQNKRKAARAKKSS